MTKKMRELEARWHNKLYNPVFMVHKWHFHWKFWKPKKCVGGPIRFGWWADVGLEDMSDMSEQSKDQVYVKTDMGLVRW